MAKFPTFPTLFDDVLQVSLSDLKKWGYLKPEQFNSGTITWSSNGQKTAAIGIAVNTRSESPYLELDYTHNGQPVNYRVQLVTVPANIGKGSVWYFLCPHTSRRCRILYSVGAKFLHRSAYPGCMYESQTYSQKNRKLFRFYEKVFNSDKLYEQLYSKHFRRTYAGKPTKRFLKLMQKIGESERIS
ncbi:hypothetical protein [Pontibacter akesuensis]|uniref:Uncharacterized protein n=1 Tax=Pontibacter akesuensis TaxID=388950 RepID=A0A1I7JN89_9BACT|nr:hypothetical protein [Pontibacter akesuensis]GHA68713.1 hypothetical protein GCM10007389_22150 [Pontibacter akesuensis]SFU86662.1 hypothetical protein SAMN04487941_3059 [Pontibacter akesuensis]